MLGPLPGQADCVAVCKAEHAKHCSLYRISSDAHSTAGVPGELDIAIGTDAVEIPAPVNALAIMLNALSNPAEGPLSSTVRDVMVGVIEAADKMENTPPSVSAEVVTVSAIPVTTNPYVASSNSAETALMSDEPTVNVIVVVVRRLRLVVAQVVSLLSHSAVHEFAQVETSVSTTNPPSVIVLCGTIDVVVNAISTETMVTVGAPVGAPVVGELDGAAVGDVGALDGADDGASVMSIHTS